MEFSVRKILLRSIRSLRPRCALAYRLGTINGNLTEKCSAHIFPKFDFPALFAPLMRENKTSLNSVVKTIHQRTSTYLIPFL